MAYALCGCIVCLFRKKSPKKLLTIGLIFLAVSTLLYVFFGFSIPFMPPESVDGMTAGWKPNVEIVQHELTAYQGSWLEQMLLRMRSSLMFQTFIFFIYIGWRASGQREDKKFIFSWAGWVSIFVLIFPFNHHREI